MPGASDFQSVFAALRAILERHTRTLAVADDTPTRYCLEAPIGPATLKAWGGKAKRPTIPVAWAEIGKSYVSFHLMALGAAPDVMSTPLRARLQGKTCFNFSKVDPALFEELETVTAKSIAAFRQAGYCS
jgi:hypothetical protein